MNDYVSKPIRQEELAAALARSATVGGSRTGADAEGALIDPDELDQLRRTVGGQEALEEVMTTFLEDTERILAELRSDELRMLARRILRLPTIEEIERELLSVVSKSLMTRSHL